MVAAAVPCPVCGGLIHPVAGRCKHCREDVRSFRTPRPPTTVALPPLTAAPRQPAPIYPSPHAPPPTSPISHAPPAMPRAAQTVLPPRTTGRQYAVDPDAAPPSAWRNWPIVVIVLAAVAIVGAVVVMVWPPAKSGTSKAVAPHATPPPAPDRMDTSPLPPTAAPAPTPHAAPAPAPSPSGDDPWNGP